MTMVICPRCGKKTLNLEMALNALSRRDNETYICSQCGDDENLIDAGYKAVDVIELQFVEQIAQKAGSD